MGHPPPEWLITERYDELQYRGLPIARIYHEPDGTVGVNTRCYSEGFTHTRRMATATGGRHYVNAWFGRWGGLAMREVDNRVAAAKIEAAQRAALPPVEIKPDPRKPRRGRKPF